MFALEAPAPSTGYRSRRICGAKVEALLEYLPSPSLWVDTYMDHASAMSPADIRDRFLSMASAEDVSSLLGISHGRMIHLLYGRNGVGLYRTFDIPKKSGGTRLILAPCPELKRIQQELCEVLHAVYAPRASVHGFVRGRSIVTNASRHLKRRYVLNLDIQDFYPSVNFGRVRGMFLAPPYAIGASAATILAQICCHNDQLPQGAPTSPIISNMICSKMDSQLLRLAQKHRCYYTRYADDMTFSTSMNAFPESLALYDDLGQVAVGDPLARIVQSNGFAINAKKTRLQLRDGRQQVTGLTVNRFANVSRAYLRQIRAMLHAWETYGLEAAEKEHHARYDRKYRNPQSEPPSFAQVVIGKVAYVGMVRGKEDSYYLLFRKQLAELLPGFAAPSTAAEERQGRLRAMVFTEGPSDWKHLKAALNHYQRQGQFDALDLLIGAYSAAGGSEELYKNLEKEKIIPRKDVRIYLFDRDESRMVQKVTGPDRNYLNWGNGVYSIALPVPVHRADSGSISIEMYYQDDEIVRRDSEGRRLFLSTEFIPKSGRHVSEKLVCTDLTKRSQPHAGIIDANVYDESSKNVALPKNDFAQNVLDELDGFDIFDFSAFRPLFELISQIIRGEK